MSWHRRARWCWEKLSVNNAVILILKKNVCSYSVETLAFHKFASGKFCMKKHVKHNSAPSLEVSEGTTSSNLHSLPCHSRITCNLVSCMEHYRCVGSIASVDYCLSSTGVVYDAASGASLCAGEGKMIHQCSAAFCGHFHLLWCLAAKWQNGTLTCAQTNTQTEHEEWRCPTSCLPFVVVQFKYLSFLRRWIRVSGVWRLRLFVT